MLFRAMKNPLTTMAESVGENLSESSDDSSASYVLSSYSITSSDSREEGESNEETPAASLAKKSETPNGAALRQQNQRGVEPVQRKVKMQRLTMKKWKRWSLGFLVRKNPIR